MKRTLWTLIVAVAVAASVSVIAQPQGPGGRGFGGGLGPGGAGRGGPGRGPGPMAILHQLDLTEAQRDQIRAIHEARREQRPGANLVELQKQLQAAVFADTPDAAKIEELKTAIASAEAAMLAGRIDTELQIAQILTAEQRAKARTLVAQGPGPGRRGRP